MNKNTIYYFIIALLFICFKYLHSIADNSHLAFMLNPISIAIEQMTGSSPIFIPEKGFFYPSLNILIDKSCSGFNFWMLCFTLFSFHLIQNRKSNPNFLYLPFLLFITYLITLLTNTSRILISIKMQGLFPFTFADNQFLTHEAIGSFIFVFFFILFYLSLHFIFLKDSHENLTQS